MLHYPMSQEQAVLFEAARMTWRRREMAKFRNLVFQEESVTETILQDIAMGFPGDLTIVPFNKIQEGQNGADWAWAFENADRTQSFAMLVQAKVLDLADKNYAKIDQKAGKTAPASKQIDLLLKTAADWRIPAVYAFYNHLSDPTRIPHRCATFPRSAPNFPIESWGISIAAAHRVAAELPDKSFDTHRLHSKPLHCLLCSRAIGVRPPSGSPQAALAAWKSLDPRPPPRPQDGMAEPSIGFAIGGRDDPFEGILHRPLPEIFVQARRIANAENDELRERLVAEATADRPNLAGVVILTDPEFPA